MGEKRNEEMVPPPFTVSEAELEIQHLKTKREELNLELERGRQRNKSEEDKFEFLQDRMSKEKDKEESLQRSISEKHLVLKGLHLERERLEQEIRREQDHYDEVRKEKNQLVRELIDLEEKKLGQDRAIQERHDDLRSLGQKLQELGLMLKSVEDQIVLKVQEERNCDARMDALKEQIRLEEMALGHLKEDSKELHKGLEKEKVQLKLLRDQVSEEGHKEKTLKQLNEELRLELMRVEGKLADRRNSYHQLEFDAQELSRKIQDHQREIESKERAIQDTKRLVLKEEEGLRDLERNLKDFRELSQREKKQLTENFQEEKERQQLEIKKLELQLKDLEESKRSLSLHLESEREKIREVQDRHEKAKRSMEEGARELSKLTEAQAALSDEISNLKSENQGLLKKKTDLEHEVARFNIKFLDNEAQFQQQQKTAHLEIEDMKRLERARISQERDSMLSEVAALKKKTLAEIEHNGDGVLSKAKIEADALVSKARAFEQDVMTKSQARLREANDEAQRRDKLTFDRFEQAERDLKVLHTEYEEKKTQVRGHLQALEQRGERHLKTLRTAQENQLKKEEKYFFLKLEKQKRREFKRVAVVRNEELAKREENLKETQKEMLEKRKFELQKLARMKEKILADLDLEREKQLQEIAQTKRNFLEQLNQNRREKETRWLQDLEKDKENFERSKRDRVSHAVSAVYHLVLTAKKEDATVGNTENDLKGKIESALTLALNGQYHETQERSELILESNPSERKKIFPVVGKYIVRFGLPAAAMAFIALDVGSMRTGTIKGIEALLKQQKSASDIFVKNQHEEWKQKYTFNPTMTPGYKASYVENVLYTKGFVELMEKEDFQNTWILALHDFIVKELELSEEVAINYISAEGTMVKEMSSLRAEINPQFLEQGLNKLRELERNFEAEVLVRIPDKTKYERFKEFRKTFYNTYADKNLNREIATERP